jgi:hypothetical protein
MSGPGIEGGGPSGSAEEGDAGPPVDVTTPPLGLSFADEDGTGNHPWAGVGLAGSRGGALRLFFGTDDAGWEPKTSLCININQ